MTELVLPRVSALVAVLRAMITETMTMTMTITKADASSGRIPAAAVNLL